MIGTFIQSFYIFRLFKRRDKVLISKHFLVRGKGLYLTHCIINFYWASIHPLIVGLCLIFHPHQKIILITLYCYGLVLLDFLLTIYCIRCWILYFNFMRSCYQFEKLWKTKLLNNHYNLSWFEIHKNFGNIRFLLIIGFIIITISCCCTIPYAYISGLSVSWYMIAGVGVFLMNVISIYLVLKLHSKSNVDNYGMRHELTIFVIICIILTTISMVLFFMFNDDWIRLWIINTPIAIATLFVNCFQFENLLNEIIKIENPDTTPQTVSRQISLSISRNHQKVYEPLKLIDILSDSAGINEFARFLIGEFSLEHLLFIIEVSQFRDQFGNEKKSLVKHRAISASITPSAEAPVEYKYDDVDHNVNNLGINTDLENNTEEVEEEEDKYEYRYGLSSKIPLCATIIDCNGEPIKQAMEIRNKFIYIKSEYGINLSGSKRKILLKTDFNKISTMELKHVFDAAYNEVFVLLELDSFQRYLETSSANKLIKRISRKRKKRRQRAKSKERSKLKKEREKAKHRQNQSVSPGLKATQNIEMKPIPMKKKLSLSVSYEMSASENENDHIQDLSTSTSVRGIYNEEQLADPFNNLYPSDNSVSKQENMTLERNVHNILHAASKHCKWCNC